MIIFLASFLFFNVKSEAATSPYYNRVEQIQTIIQSPLVEKAVTGNEIISIRYVGTEADGTYNFALSTTSVCRYNVFLDSVVGPATGAPVGKFEYVVKNINTVCLP